jgi:hypothetical protein
MLLLINRAPMLLLLINRASMLLLIYRASMLLLILFCKKKIIVFISDDSCLFFYRIWLIEVQGKQLIVASTMVAHPNKRTRQVL